MKPTKFTAWVEIELQVTADAHLAEKQTLHYPGAPAYAEITDLSIWGGDKEITSIAELKSYILGDAGRYEKFQLDAWEQLEEEE